MARRPACHSDPMKVLLTGGAGYIGSHTALVLLEQGHDVVALDNLVNSSPESLRRVGAITGRTAQFAQGDIADQPLVESVLADGVDAVIHFAGLKAVGESVAQPLDYYDNNVGGTLSLLRAMDRTGVRTTRVQLLRHGVRRPADDADHRGRRRSGQPTPTAGPRSMIEDILRDVAASDDRWHVALLRYFNPVGAHPSRPHRRGPAGDPQQPRAVHRPGRGRTSRAADRLRRRLPDARRHRRARLHPRHRPRRVVTSRPWSICRPPRSARLEPRQRPGLLGTGGLPRVRTGGRARRSPTPSGPAGRATRRSATPTRLRQRADLSWTAQLSLDEMCADHWRWQQDNPQGYAG